MVAVVLLLELDKRVHASSAKSPSSEEARARSFALRSQAASNSGVLTQCSRFWGTGLSSGAEEKKKNDRMSKVG